MLFLLRIKEKYVSLCLIYSANFWLFFMPKSCVIYLYKLFDT